MSLPLHFGDGFRLPLEFVTQTQAILAKKRVGKSYTASVQAEELLQAGQQICAIDPTGAWWGLKSSADGKQAGFPIAIFGGEHADVPLEETAGETIATALVEQRFSAILDLSLFRKGQINRFMAPFLETLYRLNREAMHLFVDEADAIAPQKPFGEEARMLGAMEDVVRRGGIRGIGTTLITQRPAVINKNVLTQCEILCALRIVHPKDIDAIREWVAVHGDERLAQQMMASLPSLPTGTAWFWAPGFGDIFRQVQVRARTTFDSGATPKAGEVKRTAKVLASVDLAKLGQQIAATVQRVKDNDPKELKRRIAELERQAKAPAPAADLDEAAVRRAIEKAIAQRDREHRDQLGQYQAVIEKLQHGMALVGKTVAQFVSLELPKEHHAPVTLALPPRVPAPVTLAARRMPRPESSGEKLPMGERAVLIAVAQYDGGVERNTISVLTGYKKSSRDTYILRLRERGYVEVQGDRVLATAPGIEALGRDYDPLPTGEALQRYWLERLPEGEKRVLEILLSANGLSIPRAVIDENTGYKKSSRDTYLLRLAARRLVEAVGRGEVRAAAQLFT